MNNQQTSDEPGIWPAHEITSHPPGVDPATRPSPTRTERSPTPRAERPATRGSSAKPRSSTQEPTILTVSTASIGLHASLQIDEDEFAAANADLIDTLVDDLRRGVPSLGTPRVVRDGERYLALDHVELAIAAGRCASHKPEVSVTVMVVLIVDPARTVREQLSNARGKSGWEQFRALEPIFAGGSVRQRLRDLGLGVGLESGVSKVLKLGRLDPEILEAVERYTIPVKEAGQVVDAWKDEGRREKMKATLADLRRASNARLDARTCFRALLACGRPEVIEPTWVDVGDGRRDYVDGTGIVLASVTEHNGRWTASGIGMGSAQWQAFGKGMTGNKGRV